MDVASSAGLVFRGPARAPETTARPAWGGPDLGSDLQWTLQG